MATSDGANVGLIGVGMLVVGTVILLVAVAAGRRRRAQAHLEAAVEEIEPHNEQQQPIKLTDEDNVPEFDGMEWDDI